jgi:hypothetical protein
MMVGRVMLIDKTKNDLALIESVKETLSNALSDGTKKTYESDIRHFEKAGFSLPTDPETLALYLTKFRETINPRTLMGVEAQWNENPR